MDPHELVSMRVGRGGAKGLPVDEPVMTPAGEVPIGELRVGSRVCAHDGTIAHVIGVYPQGKRETYEIEFDDGAIARCDDVHIWPIHVQGRERDTVRGRSMVPIDGPGYSLMTMPEVLRRWELGHRLHVPTLDRPVQFVQLFGRTMQVEPYLLGLLIGDGSLRAGDFRFFAADGELADHVLAAGFREHAPDTRNGLRIFGLARKHALYSLLGDMELTGKRAWEKSIPQVYKVANADVRLALLQGLMDTDGTADTRGHAIFCSTSEQLARDVQWLARSLGAKATVWQQKTPRRLSHKVYIQTGGKFCPFRLQRKAARCKGYQHARLWRRIVAIRPYGQRNTVCIKVDHPLGLFVTRDFVVTHNTTTKRARALIKLVTLPRVRIGYAATSKEQARDLMWDKLKESCEAYGLTKEMHFLDAPMQMTCIRTGSIYKLRGVEDKRDAEKFRGFPQSEFQVDEAGSFPPELLRYLIEDCVQPRIGEAMSLRFLDETGEDVEILRGGCIVMGSTPPAQMAGIFYEATREGSELHRPYELRDREDLADAEWSSHAWTLKDVVEHPDADRYPALQANWEKALERKRKKKWGDDHPIWQREYLGNWSADFTTTVFRYRPHKDGEPWNQWTPYGDRFVDGVIGLRLAIEALPKLGTWHFVIGMDMGNRDPFACNVFAFAPADPDKRVYHVMSYERVGVYAREIAALLLGPEIKTDKPGGVLELTGWPDGMVIDADQALIDELANVYGVKLKKAEKRADYKFGAIELVNGELLEGRLKIIAKSPLESQLATLQWKPDDNGFLKENKAQANHSSDTVVYSLRLLSSLFETGVVTQDREMPAYVDPMGLDGIPERDEFAGLLADAEFADDAFGNV